MPLAIPDISTMCVRVSVSVCVCVWVSERSFGTEATCVHVRRQHFIIVMIVKGAPRTIIVTGTKVIIISEFLPYTLSPFLGPLCRVTCFTLLLRISKCLPGPLNRFPNKGRKYWKIYIYIYTRRCRVADWFDRPTWCVKMTNPITTTKKSCEFLKEDISRLRVKNR